MFLVNSVTAAIAEDAQHNPLKKKKKKKKKRQDRFLQQRFVCRPKH